LIGGCFVFGALGVLYGIATLLNSDAKAYEKTKIALLGMLVLAAARVLAHLHGHA
jgi:hypothetical protein